MINKLKDLILVMEIEKERIIKKMWIIINKVISKNCGLSKINRHNPNDVLGKLKEMGNNVKLSRIGEGNRLWTLKI